MVKVISVALKLIVPRQVLIQIVFLVAAFVSRNHVIDLALDSVIARAILTRLGLVPLTII